MKRKLCIFCSLSSFNTGMPISTYKLAAGLVKSGRYDVCAVLPSDGELAERLRMASVDVRIIPFRRMRSGLLSALFFLMTWVVAGIRFCRFVRAKRIPVVHFSDVIDAPFYPWARFAGARVVAHVRVCLGGSAVRRFFRLWTRIFCSRVIAVSDFARRYYMLGRRAAVVYNPGPDRKIFDPNAFPRRTQAASGVPAPEPTVLMAASFRREKGHHNFLEVAARVMKRAGGKVRFVIVGGEVRGHEEYYGEVMEHARALGVMDCLTVTGNIPHENVPLVMATASVFLHMPDWEEALGGVVLEAMAMDVAVVAYDCGGVGECFTNGKSGYLVKRGDFDGAAGKVAELLKSPELIKSVTESARAELDAKFTMDKYIGGVEKNYADCRSHVRSFL
ncbi:MAG: glycosyltransferase family 4 protein [Chitinispirillia bacterium]|nr:glycosyltransferase family 4 protein [Chitinispirillia bacterium]MCL2240913.1 glycosyltransferase family 4 protein [Chitinispirillia bacterium]